MPSPQTNTQRSVRCMTLTEMIIFMGLAGVLSAIVMSFTMMARSGVTQQQHQMKYNSMGKFGGEKLVSLIRGGQAVSVVTDKEVHITHPDKNDKALQYRDKDGNEDTVEDNAIVCDPDYPSAKSYEVVSCVTKIGSEPIFEQIGDDAVKMNFHVGDPPTVEKAEYKSGAGYQGVQVRLTAKPRKGHFWSRGIEKD